MSYENIMAQVRRLAIRAAHKGIEGEPSGTLELAESLRAYPREVYERMPELCTHYTDRTYDGILRALLEEAPLGAALDAIRMEYAYTYDVITGEEAML